MTSPPSPDYARDGARGGLVLLASGAAQLITAVMATAILARLLAPADFGVFAMAMTAIALATPFQDLGLASAIVQRPVLTRGDLRLLHRMNLLLTLLLCLVTLGLGELLLRFYGEPAMRVPMLCLVVGMALRGLANVPFALLQRQRRFGRFAGITLLTSVLAALVGCALAARGFGALALAGQQFTFLSAEALLLLVASRHARTQHLGIDPDPVPQPMREWLRSSFSITGSKALGETVIQMDRLVLGRAGDAYSLGLYQNALRWAHVPMDMLLGPLSLVTISTLARLVDQVPRYRQAVRDLFETMLSLLLPAFVLLSLAAGLVVPLLLGDQWLDAIPLLRWLALAALLDGAERFAHWLHLADGRTGARFRWLLLSAPLPIAAIALGSAWGASGVAIALLVAHAVLVVPGLARALRGTPLRAADLLLPSARPVLATCCAAALVLSLGLHHDGDTGTAPGQLSRLLALSATFGSVYALVWWSLPGGRARWTRMVGLLQRPRAS